MQHKQAGVEAVRDAVSAMSLGHMDSGEQSKAVMVAALVEDHNVMEARHGLADSCSYEEQVVDQRSGKLGETCHCVHWGQLMVFSARNLGTLEMRYASAQEEQADQGRSEAVTEVEAEGHDLVARKDVPFEVLEALAVDQRMKEPGVRKLVLGLEGGLVLDWGKLQAAARVAEVAVEEGI